MEVFMKESPKNKTQEVIKLDDESVQKEPVVMDVCGVMFQVIT
jgi:hypothetical protein